MVKMFGRALICLWTLNLYNVASVSAQGECTDLRGQLISHGLHYVPGPDTCTLCVCDNGMPKVCKAVLCSPPQDCRSFRVGHTCCEFICLDDVVKPPPAVDPDVRFAVVGVLAVVILTVALVVYRVKRQKRRGRAPHADDQRSLTSIGYISGSMGYMGGTCETALAAWKPPGNYLPRGEAPPPYDEAVAQCRPDPRVMNEQAFHRAYPSLEPGPPPELCGHAYANVPRPVTQLANPSGCYNAPLLQPAHPEMPPPHHPLANNVPVVGFSGAIHLTGSLGAISNRGLLSLLQRPVHERHPPYPTNNLTLHRTIPRISTADTALESQLFSRADRALAGDVRRSFHRPAEPRLDAGRSMPRNLNLTHDMPLASSMRVSNITAERSRARSEEQNIGAVCANPVPSAPPAPIEKTGPIPPQNKPGPIPPQNKQGPIPPQNKQGPIPPQNKPGSFPPQCQPGPIPQCQPGIAGSAGPQMKPGIAQQNKPGSIIPQPGKTTPPIQVHQQDTSAQTLPLTIDKPSCVCSYAGAGAEPAEDQDDYRSECENCKSTSSSRWAVNTGGAEWEEETQTLQRRAPPAPAPATATLPQPVTRPPRTIMGPPSNWENWFNTIPDSDTESEEE